MSNFANTARNLSIIRHAITMASNCGFTVQMTAENMLVALMPLGDYKVEAIKVLRSNIRNQQNIWLSAPANMCNISIIAAHMLNNYVSNDAPIGLKEAKDIADILWENLERT